MRRHVRTLLLLGSIAAVYMGCNSASNGEDDTAADGSGGSGNDSGGSGNGGKAGSGGGGKAGSGGGGKAGSGGASNGGSGGANNGGSGGGNNGGSGGGSQGGEGGGAEGGSGGGAKGGAGGSGGAAGMAGSMGGAGGCLAAFNGDCSRFHFEFDVNRFADLSGTRGATVIHDPQWVQDPAKVKTGKGSVSWVIETFASRPGGGMDTERVVGAAYKASVGLIVPGKPITGWLWVPAGHLIGQVELFVHGNSPPPNMGGRWNSQIVPGDQLMPDAWNFFTVVPDDSWAGAAGNNGTEIGFRFLTLGDWKGTVYIDSVNVQVR